MNGRFVTNRREIKYLVSTAQAEEFRQRLGHVLIPDPHDDGRGYHSYSVYFDSPRLTFYKEKVAGLATRMKPRLRTYRAAFDDAPAAIFLEFKLRERHVIAKERTAVDAAEADRILSGRAAGGPAGTPDDPIIGKFAALAGKMDLKPCAGILYHRTAFSFGGQPGLRITFDRRLQCTGRCELNPPAEAFSPIEPFDRSVIELKYDAELPNRILKMTARMEPCRLPYSKYARGVERVRKIDPAAAP